MVYFLPIIPAVDGKNALSFLIELNLYINMIPCILTAAALCVVAWERGLRYPWLALIPIADLWVLGKLADTYHLYVRSRKNNMRFLLPGLGTAAMLAPGVISAIDDGLQLLGYGKLGDLLSIVGMFAAVSIWGFFLVFRYIAVCDIYRAGTTGKEGLYMVLSVIFPFLIPFFIFKSR